MIIHSAPVSSQIANPHQSAQHHGHHQGSRHPQQHINLQIDVKDYGTQNQLNDAGEAVNYNWQNVNRYEGELNEDKRLFDFEEPGDY